MDAGEQKPARQYKTEKEATVKKYFMFYRCSFAGEALRLKYDISDTEQ